MAEKQQSALKTFKAATLELQAFLRKRPSLTEAEQLSLENCLVMLQMELMRVKKHKAGELDHKSRARL